MRIGAIFDWDGVVIDSSRCHEKSWDILASEEKLSLPPGHFQKSFGMRNELIIPQISHWSTDPRHCVVFKDAPAGIAAAHNGGMKVVGIATTRPAQLLKNADIVIPSFDELDYMKLKELFYSTNGNAA